MNIAAIYGWVLSRIHPRSTDAIIAPLGRILDRLGTRVEALDRKRKVLAIQIENADQEREWADSVRERLSRLLTT